MSPRRHYEDVRVEGHLIDSQIVSCSNPAAPSPRSLPSSSDRASIDERITSITRLSFSSLTPWISVPALVRIEISSMIVKPNGTPRRRTISASPRSTSRRSKPCAASP